ncbi:MAG TPA: hypothetical protein PKE45_26010, partial [Caldilineaceae bacterium]|nr:hypothetical protein [Caldilineaceae bacterium]
MLTQHKDRTFVAYTTANTDDTIPQGAQSAIPYTILAATVADPTMLLNLPAVAELDLTPIDWPPEQHPAIVYLASLSVSPRRPQATALAAVAAILTGGRCAALQLPWQRLRFVHTNAVRATLAERYAPATANRYLAALRGVLKACWQLDLIDQQTLA